MKKKVIVAMSGGVDSSVAAFLLKKHGFDAIGVTMCLGVDVSGQDKARCCGPKEIQDAKKVCRILDMPHYVFDFSRLLQEKIIDNFVSEYAKGRTPNPCVECNRSLKFGELLRKTRAMGFDFLATGHYARLEKSGKKYLLKKSKDKKKDQTYFLYSIPKAALAQILFPLGNYTKDEVRAIARKAGLPVAEKKESQDICFVTEGNYKKFLAGLLKNTQAGEIVDTQGRVLGAHNGISRYTIGQRKGLNIASNKPLYVLSIDAENNRVIVGEKQFLRAKGLIIKDLNLFFDRLPKEAYVKIRYGHKPEKAKLRKEGDTLKALFFFKQESITPGQSAVIYKGNAVIGGGIISGAL